MKSWNLLLASTLVLGSLLTARHTFGATVSDPTQTVAGGGVTAKVTYLNPKTPDEPRFRIVLDTHSVNLDAYDIKSIAVLRDDTGRSYLPTNTEAKGSGHHREAVISFPKLRSTGRLELVITDVAGVKERIFVWSLE